MRTLTQADDARDLHGRLMEMGKSGLEMIRAFEYHPENVVHLLEFEEDYKEALSQRDSLLLDQ